MNSTNFTVYNPIYNPIAIYIVYCMIGFNKLREIKPYIETVLPHIDKFVYVDGGSTGSSVDGTLEYLQSINQDNKIIILHHNWNDNFSEARNEYISFISNIPNKELWILTSDTDEHFPIETLTKLRIEIENAILENYDGIKIRAFDIITENNITIKNEISSAPAFYKPLLFKYNPDIHYRNSVHESLDGISKWKELDLIYCHKRTQRKIYERAVQNFFISDKSSTAHNEFIELCTKNKLSSFTEFFKHYLNGILPEEIENWLYTHRNYKLNESDDIQVLELRDTANFYFKLHFTIKIKGESKIKTISTYIITYDALFYQSTLEQTIRHALLFSDEIIVANSEESTDGTMTLLDNIHAEYPNIIKLYTYKEDHVNFQQNLADRKSFALAKCTKDYCILQDDDECIHEQYADYIKQLPTICPDTTAFRFNTIHFYRSYNHYQPKHGDWYDKKIYMFKNIPEIAHGGNDLDNHIIKINHFGSEQIVPLDSLPNIVNTPVTSYHYGWTRNDAILLLKKYHQEIQCHGNDYWKTCKFPFKFDNPNNLPKFTGNHPKYMIPVIAQEQKYKSRQIKEFTKNTKTQIKILHVSDCQGDLSIFENACAEDSSIIVSTGDFLPNILHDGTNSGSKQDDINYQLDFIRKNKKRIIGLLRNRPLIYVQGNHDWINLSSLGYDKSYELNNSEFIYKDINNSICKFYGFPNVIGMKQWNHYTTNDEIRDLINRIPVDTDILVTHSPPKNILDRAVYGSGDHDGLTGIHEKIKNTNVKLHLFGHVHENNGLLKIDDVTYSNASRGYRIINFKI